MRSPDTVLSDWRNRVQDNGIRASRIAVGLGAAVVLIVILSAVTSAWVLREQAINEWRRHLSNLSVILAEQTSLVVSSTYLVLDDITEEIKRSSITDAAALRRQTSGPATYEMLREKTRNSRWIDVATIVDAHGDVINFSRSFPAPPINVADRDYFRAHAANPGPS